jgi:hypothetical protein
MATEDVLSDICKEESDAHFVPETFSCLRVRVSISPNYDSYKWAAEVNIQIWKSGVSNKTPEVLFYCVRFQSFYTLISLLPLKRR